MAPIQAALRVLRSRRPRPPAPAFVRELAGSRMTAVSRRRVLAGLLLAACGKSHSTSTTGPGEVSAARVPSKRASTLVGYGLANGWPTADAPQLATLLASNGLTLTEIEYIPFDDLGQINPARTAAFVAAMRARGITTFINVANWNGDRQTAQDERWFRQRVREIRAVVGTAGVVLQGLSEPEVRPRDLPRGSEWQRIARQEWDGGFVVYARHSKTPFYAAGPYDYIDTHHCQVARMVDFMRSAGPQLINNTDCTPLIATRLGAGVAGRLTRQAVDHGTNLLIYDYERSAPSEAIVREMGSEAQRA